ncbi:hypothetical protein F4805DRAFT_442254 [Annulohypoxylon moriforme]|nr:hypothetical protein F4805DRAFT_442254 [Annulohypoxylon moriforme]
MAGIVAIVSFIRAPHAEDWGIPVIWFFPNLWLNGIRTINVRDDPSICPLFINNYVGFHNASNLVLVVSRDGNEWEG